VSTQSDTLLIKIETDGAGKVSASLAGTGQALKGVDKDAKATGQSLGNLKGIMLGLATAGATKFTFGAIMEFERLNATLKTVTGSSQGAARAMEWIEDFGATTPYEIGQITQAFIKLKAVGLDPSRAALESYGNTASAMNKDINQFVDAVVAATTGEMESLKQFGIVARQEGDKVKFLFNDVTTTVGKNSYEIEQYLMAIGNNQFAGAMAEQADTLVGKVSNLQDAFGKLGRTIGQVGGTSFLSWVSEGTTEGLNNLSRGLVEFVDGVENLSLADLNAELEEAANKLAKFESIEWDEAATESMRQRVALLKKYIAEKKAQGDTDENVDRKAAAAQKEAADAAAKHNDALDKHAEKLKDAVDPMRVLAKDLSLYDELLTANKINFEQWALAVENAYDRAEKASDDSADKQNENLAELEAAIRGWGDEFTDTFIDALETGEARWDDFVRAILRDIARIVITQTLTKPMVNAIVSGLGGTTTGQALGGAVNANQTYLVGEMGPELFVPREAGSIVPNNKLGGDVSVTNNINVGGGDGDVEQRVMAVLPLVVAQTREALLQEIERGGRMAQAVGRRAA